MYTKPELVAVSTAIQAIQHSQNKGCNCLDGHTGEDTATIAAYEADE